MTQTDFTQFLQNRRSSKVATLQAPGPSEQEIQTILKIASRVPDHGKYAPWYFLVFEGENRLKTGKLLKEAYRAENDETAEAKLILESERLMRAPLVIAVVSRIRPGKHAQWEQILSAGAACFNLCLAANSLGYGSNWLTEWYSYSPYFKKALGLDTRDHIAGFVYIGTCQTPQEDRERPNLDQIVTWWDGNTPINKGDGLEKPGSSLPLPGFRFPL